MPLFYSLLLVLSLNKFCDFIAFCSESLGLFFFLFAVAEGREELGAGEEGSRRRAWVWAVQGRGLWRAGVPAGELEEGGSFEDPGSAVPFFGIAQDQLSCSRCGGFCFCRPPGRRIWARCGEDRRHRCSSAYSPDSASATAGSTADSTAAAASKEGKALLVTGAAPEVRQCSQPARRPPW